MRCPLISVILPVYNQEAYLSETINSVLNQTFSNFEFLILDDGSTDNSLKIIKEFAEKDVRIHWLSRENKGKCISTNELVKLSKSDFLVFLDADDVMVLDRIETQFQFHINNPTVLASSGNCIYINKHGKEFGVQNYTNLTSIEKCQKAFETLEFVHCSFPCLFMHKSAFLQTGGLKEKYWGSEDFEFFNRLIELRILIVVLPNVLMKYRLHKSSITASDPFFVYDKIGFVMDCLGRRRKGSNELTFEEFMKIRDSHPWYVKLNRKRYNYAQLLFRNAGIDIMSKNYYRFVLNIIGVLFLSPKYIYDKAVRLVFKAK